MSKLSCLRTRAVHENITLRGLEPRPLDLETNARIIGSIIRGGLELGERIKKIEQQQQKSKNKKMEVASEGKNVSLNIDQNTSVKREIEVFRHLKFQALSSRHYFRKKTCRRKAVFFTATC